VKVKLIVEGGAMKPGPAVAQQLGPMGINLGKVIEDVRYFVEEMNAEYLFFWADNFLTYSNDDIDEFCEAYSDFKVPFFVQSYPVTLKDYKIKKLAEVGLHREGGTGQVERVFPVGHGAITAHCTATCRGRSPGLATTPVRSAMMGRRPPLRSGRSVGEVDRLHLDRVRLSIQRANDAHLLAGEWLRRPLVTQHVDVLAVEQDVRGAVGRHAGLRACGVRRTHSHGRVARLGALAVGDGAGKRPSALGRGQ